MQLALRQIKYENKAFWRNPAAAFFTFLFPLMFLVIFNLAFGGERDSGTNLNLATAFIIPAITAFSVINACYTNIAMSLSFARDEGVLKRVRGTPLPTVAFMAGRIGHAIFVALLLVAIVLAAGVLFYGVDLPGRTLPAFFLTLAVGAASFCSLGFAVTCVVPNADAAPAVVNFTILPLLFISDIFLHIANPPGWLDFISRFFPIKHFAQAMQVAFNPFTTGAGYRWGDLLVIALWGIAGLLISIRFFSWEPRR